MGSKNVSFIRLLRTVGSCVSYSRFAKILSGVLMERPQNRFTSLHQSFGLVCFISLRRRQPDIYVALTLFYKR